MQKLTHHQHFRKGFTLIELSLSIAFIGILSITVALIINNAIMSYRRGLTLSQVNTAGMDLIDDMRASIQNSPTKSVKDQCSTVQNSSTEVQASPNNNESETDQNDVNPSEDQNNYLQDDSASDCDSTNGLGFVSIKSSGKVADGIENVPLYGAFCTGTYSYLWNSGYFFSDKYENGSNKTSLLSLKIGDKSYNNFKLLKIHDINRAVCVAAVGGYENKYDLNNLNNNNIIIVPEGSISFSPNDKPYDLLDGEYTDSDDENKNTTGLAIYDLDSTAPAGNDLIHSLFYSVSFILGTPRGGINIDATGDFCKPPKDYDNNFDYCAINKFNFAAQATGA